MRPLEDGSSPDREIGLAGLDAVNFAAVWADWRAVPAAFFDMKTGGPLVGEFLEEFVGADGDFLHFLLACVVRIMPVYLRSSK